MFARVCFSLRLENFFLFFDFSSFPYPGAKIFKKIENWHFWLLWHLSILTFVPLIWQLHFLEWQLSFFFDNWPKIQTNVTFSFFQWTLWEKPQVLNLTWRTKNSLHKVIQTSTLPESLPHKMFFLTQDSMPMAIFGTYHFSHKLNMELQPIFVRFYNYSFIFRRNLSLFLEWKYVFSLKKRNISVLFLLNQVISYTYQKILN